MRLFRNLIHARRHLALLLVMMTLSMKVLVPSGYMLSAGSKTITIGLCTGTMGVPQTTTITIPMDPSAPAKPAHTGKTDGACAFSVLSMGAMGGADMATLAVALAFILLLCTAFIRQPVVQKMGYWHPPLRGPPSRV